MIIFIIAFTIFIIYIMVRVGWVGKTQFDWCDKVYNYRIDLISNNKIEEYDKYNYFDFTDSVYSYDKMMLHFWLWNIKYMIEDQELYNIIVKSNEN